MAKKAPMASRVTTAASVTRVVLMVNNLGKFKTAKNKDNATHWAENEQE
jgi:hypothetical protein